MAHITIIILLKVTETIVECLVGTTMALDAAYAFPSGPSPKASSRGARLCRDKVPQPKKFIMHPIY